LRKYAGIGWVIAQGVGVGRSVGRGDGVALGDGEAVLEIRPETYVVATPCADDAQPAARTTARDPATRRCKTRWAIAADRSLDRVWRGCEFK
jgi:hypothetical protein